MLNRSNNEFGYTTNRSLSRKADDMLDKIDWLKFSEGQESIVRTKVLNRFDKGYLGKHVNQPFLDAKHELLLKVFSLDSVDVFKSSFLMDTEQDFQPSFFSRNPYELVKKDWYNGFGSIPPQIESGRYEIVAVLNKPYIVADKLNFTKFKIDSRAVYDSTHRRLLDIDTIEGNWIYNEDAIRYYVAADDYAVIDNQSWIMCLYQEKEPCLALKKQNPQDFYYPARIYNTFNLNVLILAHIFKHVGGIAFDDNLGIMAEASKVYFLNTASEQDSFKAITVSDNQISNKKYTSINDLYNNDDYKHSWAKRDEYAASIDEPKIEVLPKNSKYIQGNKLIPEFYTHMVESYGGIAYNKGDHQLADAFIEHFEDQYSIDTTSKLFHVVNEGRFVLTLDFDPSESELTENNKKKLDDLIKKINFIRQKYNYPQFFDEHLMFFIQQEGTRNGESYQQWFSDERKTIFNKRSYNLVSYLQEAYPNWSKQVERGPVRFIDDVTIFSSENDIGKDRCTVFFYLF